MFELENTILDFHRNYGRFPQGREIRFPLDAWNNEMHMQVGDENASYDFLVTSNGPDGNRGSEDDMFLVHNMKEFDIKEKGAPKKKPSPSPEISIPAEGMEDLIADDASSQRTRAGTRAADDTDRVLEGKSDSAIPPKEIETYGDLGESKPQSGKEEVILTLDELEEKL
jgi:hypothetical protein